LAEVIGWTLAREPQDRPSAAELTTICHGYVITSPSVRAASSRLEEQQVMALELRARAELFCGRHTQLVPHMQDLVRQYPYREEFWGQLMLALYRSGRRAEALATYRSVHQLLDSELALEPGTPVKQLHRRTLRELSEAFHVLSLRFGLDNASRT
jgi:DNA-binding SARP family transcriptional activator